MNKMFYLLSIIFFLILVSCSGKKQENNQNKQTQKATYEKSDTSSTLYVFENDEKRQILDIVYISETEIKFILKLVTKRTTCNITETGTAYLEKLKEEPEMEIDENGLAFPVNEFIYTKGKLKMSFRIDYEDKTRALVLLDGYYTTCYPASTELLKKWN